MIAQAAQMPLGASASADVCKAAAPAFDWREPDYRPIYAERAERLRRMRGRPETLSALKSFYSEHIAEFIADWGVTADPRNALRHPPRETLMPFLLFPKQREWVEWVLDRARAREPGLTEKSRDCGISWLAMCTAVTVCLFRPNIVIGVGSAKEDKVDRSGDPDCLFWKARTFLKHLPTEFRGSWDENRNSAHMRLTFPETASAMVGEAGDHIGRGGRSSIYFVDEAAHLERPKLVEASLAGNTDTRIDISSVAGMANTFAEKRHSGRVKIFTFNWRDDPRKGPQWYAEQQAKLDPVTLAQEVDINYAASAEGVLIPGAWIQSAVDSLKRLGLPASGVRCGALDVADEGKDRNAFAGRHGSRLEFLRSWSGTGSDLLETAWKAFACCDERTYQTLWFDADGLGAGVRGDARSINEQREAGRKIVVEPYRGSESPVDPGGQLIDGRINQDTFANQKAMSWWGLRMRFEATHRAVAEGGLCLNPDVLISIDPDLGELQQLLQELSQPTYSINAAGKFVIDKAPQGFKSPNLADAVCMVFSPVIGPTGERFGGTWAWGSL